MRGIYLIKNKVNNKAYVGLSTNLHRRIYRHKWALNNNRHENSHLQNAWNKYGSKNFTFKIIEKFDKITLDELAKKEIYYIEKYNSYCNGYNRSCGGECTANYKLPEERIEKMRKSMIGNTYSLGIKRSEETKKKQSESFKKRKDLKEHSERGRKTLTNLWKNPEYRVKMHNLNMGNKYGLGNKMSEEQRRKISERQQGEKNTFYGKHHTEETKRKISENTKRNWQNEEYIKKNNESRNKVMQTEEYKHKISLTSRGEKNNKAKLKEKDAVVIRLRYLKGEKVKEIYKDYYNVISYSAFSKICYYETWKHIPKDIEKLQQMLINYQS